MKRHTRNKGGVSIYVDERSIRTFKKRVDALLVATGEEAKKDLIEFCTEVLKTSNELVPIDTGTLAESADFIVTKRGDTYTARMGYGIRRNPTNPRTGKKASQYAGIVHESYHFTPTKDMPYPTGQGKFFEKALALHANDFYDKLGKSLKSKLAVATLPENSNVSITIDTFSSNEWRARAQQGFTAKHGGKILPYPAIGGAAKTKQKATKKTAQSVREKVSARYKRASTHSEYKKK